MNKLYSVHDHWTDINKKNDVDIESIDGVITGIKVNGEDYGGSITWESVYSGTIDPEGEVPPYSADISLTMTATDLIRVVYDGVVYVLPKQVFNENIFYGAEPASVPTDIDFTIYPFLINVRPDTIRVYTETAGLHTLDISQPQSGGGSSDFSTAEVTIINNTSDTSINFLMPTFMETPFISSTYQSNLIFSHQTVVKPIILYKNKGNIAVRDYEIYETQPNFSVTGSIEYIGDGEFYITGNGTITIS